MALHSHLMRITPRALSFTDWWLITLIVTRTAAWSLCGIRRPMPKFLCVKGILFFSFWQALSISALVAAGIIRKSKFFPYVPLAIAIILSIGLD